MATPTQETDTFVQALQRFHDGLPPSQQRMLQTILTRATQSPAAGTAPEVQGYAASTGATAATWSNLTRFLNTLAGLSGPGGRTN